MKLSQQVTVKSIHIEHLIKQKYDPKESYLDLRTIVHYEVECVYDWSDVLKFKEWGKL